MMSDATETLDTAAINAKERDIYWLNRHLSQLSGEAWAAEQRAETLRSVASQMTNNIDPLRGVFTPVHRYHTVNTWEGNAATQSRTRLDTHEGRTTGAITTLDGIVDDLYDAAALADGAASSARSQASSTSWRLSQARDDLDELRRA